jgi:hypothetical protein
MSHGIIRSLVIPTYLFVRSSSFAILAGEDGLAMPEDQRLIEWTWVSASARRVGTTYLATLECFATPRRRNRPLWRSDRIPRSYLI